MDIDDPLETLLGSIRDCLNGGLYYAGLVVALTVPDVCAALESEDGKTSNQKYKDWYESYLGELYKTLTSDDCYSLRCSVVHQGKFGHPNNQYRRVLFTVPNSQKNVYHNNIVENALNIDAICFCTDVMNAARKWYDTKRTDPNVIKNLQNLVSYRPDGLHPYMVGIPLIA
jgi:hypothetical protein